MKKIFLMVLAGSIYLTSCKKDEALSPDNQSITVSNSVSSTLRIAFPNASDITYSEVSPIAVVAEFTNKKTEMVAGLLKTGKLLYKGESIEASELPAIALDYLTANYAGYALKRASVKKDDAGLVTGYSTDITHNNLKYHIHFDATGKFLTVVERTGKHNGQGVKIAQADLPAVIKTYLTSNYPNYTFDDAISFSVDNAIKGYGVRITTSDAKEVGLMFDAAGVFLRSREGDLGHHSGKGPGKGKGGDKGGKGNDGLAVVKIEKSAVPAAALTYLDSKYAGYAFVYAESYSLNTVVQKYEVEFTLNGKTYEVYFDAKGVFLKEKIKN